MRVGEHADVVELHRANKVRQLLEVLGRLPGIPDDERGPERDTGNARADPVEQALVAGARARPFHALQHRVGRVLQRQVHVAAHLVQPGHGVQHVVGDRGRVEVQHPDPLDAVHVLQRLQQARQGAALAAVVAVERRVLRDEQQLLDAARGQRVRFLDHGIVRPAAVVPAQRRDDAEAALVVTAFGHLDVGVVAGGGEQPRRFRVVKIRGKRAAWLRAPGSGLWKRIETASPFARRSRTGWAMAPMISGTSPVPRTASISGICSSSSAR